MGHVRLGQLARSRKWRQVVDLLQSGGSVEEIARTSAEAAETALKRAASDPAFADAFWLLTRLPLAARGPGYPEALREVGLDVDGPPTLLQLTQAATRALDDGAAQRGGRSDLGEMAQLALVESLTAAIGPRLPSLFEPQPAEVRQALGRLASGEAFAELSRHFFSRLTQRTLDYYLSRELALHVGADGRFSTDAERRRFDEALATHCLETSRIVRDFSGGWYGKTVWQQGDLSRESAGKFASVAFKKIRKELGRRRDAA